MNATHAENIETIRCALATENNAYMCCDQMGVEIFAAALADAETAAEMVAALPHAWPETPDEVDENAFCLWLMR